MGLQPRNPLNCLCAVVFEKNSAVKWSWGRYPVLDWGKGEELGACYLRSPTHFKLYAHDGETITVICFPCQYSSVAGSIYDMILNQNTQKIRIMFWHSHLHKRHLQFHCTQTCRYGANGLCNPFEQLLDPMLKVFLLITELLLNRILIFFSAELSSPQYLLLCWRCYVLELSITRFFLSRFQVCRFGAYHYTLRWQHNPSA